MNITNEFRDYAIKHMGISPIEFYQWEQLQEKLYGANASLTPYILEEREMRVTQMDIFSRMMMDRILHLYGPVNDSMASITQAQLLFLDNLEKNDITLHISSPGGSVLSGLGIIDVMNYISSDVKTINMGLCASMASVILSSGTKGKRYSLKNSRVMLHTVSSGAEGKVQDMRISLREAEKYNNVLFEILSNTTGKDKETILIDSDRDYWLDSLEAKEYGLIDEIIISKTKLNKK